MKVSSKQDYIAEQIGTGKKEIMLEGAIGTSKTYGMAAIFFGIALDYPGSRIFVARRHLTEMRTSTIPTFEEVAGDMHMVAEKNYRLTQGSLPQFKIFCDDGQPFSYIYFIGLDHIKDPQFIKIKGINATCAGIDEADGVSELGATTLSSRTGRANKNGAPDFIIYACNANDSWPKRRLYDKFKEPAKYGELEPDQCVIEFDLEDSFLGEDHYKKYDRNPPQWKARYLYNDWSYGDDEGSLFKYRNMDSIHVSTYERGHKTASLDVARTGKDRSVLSVWENSVLVDIVIIKDYDEQKDGGEQAREVYEYCTKNDIGYEDLIIDGVGVGVTVVDNLKTLYDWTVDVFIAGGMPQTKKDFERKKKQFPNTPVPVITYNNLRSEQTYLLSVAIENGTIKFYDNCPYLSEFKKDATMHNYETKDKMLVLEPKDKVKERTGHSPDVFDSVMMGYYKHCSKQAIGTYSNRRTAKEQESSPITRLSVKNRPITRGLMKKHF